VAESPRRSVIGTKGDYGGDVADRGGARKAKERGKGSEARGRSYVVRKDDDAATRRAWLRQESHLGW
jgi:hypothetical protein